MEGAVAGAVARSSLLLFEVLKLQAVRHSVTNASEKAQRAGSHPVSCGSDWWGVFVKLGGGCGRETVIASSPQGSQQTRGLMETVFCLVAFSSLQKCKWKTVFISTRIETLFKSKGIIGIIKGPWCSPGEFLVPEGRRSALHFHYIVIRL